MVIRISVEQMSEDLGVLISSRCPLGPKVVTQRVFYELPAILVFVDIILGVYCRRHSIDVALGVEGLRWQKTHVLPPEVSSKRRCVVTSLEGLAIHGALNLACIFHDDAEFAVMITLLTSIVEVTGATYSNAVIHNQELRMNVQFLLDPISNFRLGVVFIPRFLAQFALPSHSVMSN